MALQHGAGHPRLAHELRRGRRPVCGRGLGQRRVQLLAAFLRSRKSKVKSRKLKARQQDDPFDSSTFDFSTFDFQLSKYAADSPLATCCATIFESWRVNHPAF